MQFTQKKFLYQNFFTDSFDPSGRLSYLDVQYHTDFVQKLNQPLIRSNYISANFLMSTQ